MQVSLAMLLLVIIPLAKGTPPKFPNIGYVGSTYNLFKGNPQSTKGIDPGFIFRNIFHYNYEGNKTSADGRYSVPDGIDAVGTTTCTFTFSSSVIQSTASYFDSLSVNVNADFKGWGASFSASVDYKNVHKGSTSSNTMYVKSHATCSAYTSTVVLSTSENLNPVFVKAVNLLPAQSNDSSIYMDFFDHWGTHYAHKIIMGGRYGVQSSFSTYDIADMTSSELNIKASAGYSGLFSLNANLGTDIEKNQSRQFENKRQDYELFQIGGKPPVSENMSTFEWAQTVKSNPLPLSYHLIPITDLLTTQNFPGDYSIILKKSSLMNAISAYCEFLDVPVTEACYSSNNRPAEDSIKFEFGTEYGHINWTLSSSEKTLVFLIPNAHTTQQHIIGTLVKQRHSYLEDNEGKPFFIHDSNLVSSATSWTIKKLPNTKNVYGLRPHCKEGFNSVTDFFCHTGTTVDDCLTSFPRTRPCISNKCLTQCRFAGADEDSYAGGYINRIYLGVEALNNPEINSRYFFARQIFVNEDITDLSLAMCLNFDCLNFA